MQAPQSPFYQRVSAFSLRYRYLVLAFYTAVTGGLGYQAVHKLVVDNSTEAFVVADSGPAQVLQTLYADFGSDQYVQVVVQGDVFTRGFLTRLEALHGQLAAIDVELEGDASEQAAAIMTDPEQGATGDFGSLGTQGFRAQDFGEDDSWGQEAGGTVIEDAQSLINARDIRTDANGALQVNELLRPLPAQERLSELKLSILADPSIVGRVVGKDGRHAVVLLRLVQMSEYDSRKVIDRALEIAAAFQQTDFEVHVAGVPAMNTGLNRIMSQDMVVMSVASLTLAGLVLLYLFRHLLAALGPALVIGQAFGWILGLMALADVRLTMVTSALPTFITAVGLGDAIHIQSTYRDARAAGRDNQGAIRYALGHTGTPIAYTSFTTMIGLLSFQFASLPAIQDLGYYGALGVFFAYVLSTTFLPALLSFNRTSMFGARATGSADGSADGTTSGEGGPDGLDRFLAICSGLSAPVRGSQRRLWTTLTVGGILLVFFVASMTQLRVYHNIMGWFPEGLPLKVATETLDENVGGTASVVLLVAPRNGHSLDEPAVLQALEALEKDILAYDDPVFGTTAVSNISSLLDLVRETNRALHGGDEAYNRVPDDRRAIRDILTLLENSGGGVLKQVMTLDMASAMVVVRVRWMDASGYEPLVAYLEQAIETRLAGLADVQVTGSVHNLFWVVVRLLDDLLRSFSLAFVVITVVMLFLLRDFKLGLLAMVPNLMPVLAILAFMVWTGIPIDINNLMIASVAIGIAVDDTIHFLHQFQGHYKEHGDTEAAISHSFATTGRAMVSTTMIMVTGFCVFLFATLINMQRFGVLMMLTVLGALIIDLVLAPALLRALYGPGRSGSVDSAR